MAKKRRKKRITRRRGTLSGVSGSATRELTIKESIGHSALAAVLGVGAAGIGAGLGPFSIPLGLASVIYGVKRNDKTSKFLLATGIGLIAGTSIQRAIKDASAPVENVEGLEGFGVKSMIGNSKSYFKNFAKKFSLPFGKKNEEVNGLNGEEVNYFINPYTNQNKLDLSELDNIQAQIREMKTVEGVGEIDPGVRNF